MDSTDIRTPAQDTAHLLSFKHAGKSYQLTVHATDMVLDLKSALFSLTNVPPERQKIIGLSARPLLNDILPLSELHLENVKKPFTLIGTPDGEEVKRIKEAGDITNAEDDLSPTDSNLVLPTQAVRNERKINEAVTRLKDISFMNAPRPGKKLIVFDLDYTLLDCKDWLDSSIDMLQLARPGLNQCLVQLSPFYDFLIWSQTSWRFLEAKLVELNMINDQYSIACVLDKTSMFEVVSQHNGTQHKHHVKPLEIIWRKWPEYFSPSNTCHVDDLARNFVLNPESGIKIRAFKDAKHHKNDRELILLTAYVLLIHRKKSLEIETPPLLYISFLLSIKDEPDLRKCNLSEWRKQAKLLAGYAV